MKTVTLDKVGITVVLHRLAKDQGGSARSLYGKLMSSWGHRPDRQRVSVKLGDQELQVIRNLDLPGGILGSDVVASGWYVTYRHPKKPKLEVRVRTKSKPPKKRIFKIGGKRVRLVAVKATHVGKRNTHKEAVMARKAATKKRKDEEEELDELEGLEDLDDLDELEDEEEPEDEEDEDEEDEEPAPKRSRSKTSKPKAKTTKSKSRSRKAAEEDEDDDEDEDEESAPKRKKASTSKAKSTKKKAKSNGGGNLPGTRELPKGKVGPQDIADMVGDDCDARYVRIFLRDSDDWEREEGGRWAFSKTEAKQLVREIKAKRRG